MTVREYHQNGETVAIFDDDVDAVVLDPGGSDEQHIDVAEVLSATVALAVLPDGTESPVLLLHLDTFYGDDDEAVLGGVAVPLDTVVEVEDLAARMTGNEDEL